MFYLVQNGSLIPEQTAAASLAEAAQIAWENEEPFTALAINPARGTALDVTGAVAAFMAEDTFDREIEPPAWLLPVFARFGLSHFEDRQEDVFATARGRRVFGRDQRSTLNHVQQFGGRP